MAAKRAVFLERDGVINPYFYRPDFGTVDSPSTPEQFELLPGVADAIAEFNGLNLAVIVVSNQPGVAKGKFSQRILQAITIKMVKQLADAGARLDDVLYCTHHPQARLREWRVACGCRKPKPGLLLRAAQEHHLDLAGSFMVGDGVKDVQAGRAAGATTILLSPRRCLICEEFSSRRAQPHRIAADLNAAARIIGALAVCRLQFPSFPSTIDACPPARGEAAYDDSRYAKAHAGEARANRSQMEGVEALLRAVRGYAETCPSCGAPLWSIDSARENFLRKSSMPETRRRATSVLDIPVR